MDRVQFEWSRPEEGYRWVSGTEPDAETGEPWEPTGRYLVEIPSARRALYQPFKQPDLLFTRFAELEPTENAVLRFANEVGGLGAPAFRALRAHSNWIGGEPLTEWANQIQLMQQAFGIWRALADTNVGTLGSHFISGVQGIYFERHPEHPRPWAFRDWIAKRDRDPDLMRELERGHPFSAARIWLQMEMNRQLEGRVSARVLQESEVGFSSATLFIVPSTLLSAMWLQFAKTMTLNHELRSCPECGMWFEIAPDFARTNRTYCRDACKSRAYRKRRGPASTSPASGRNSRGGKRTASSRGAGSPS